MVSPPNTSPAASSDLDTGQSFQLIDSILPFEACLYHQLLPLAMDGSTVKLGMVNPDDTTALEYVRCILAYMNCSLQTQPLTTKNHQAILSAYLNFKQTQTQKVSPPPLTNWQEKATFILDQTEAGQIPPPQPEATLESPVSPSIPEPTTVESPPQIPSPTPETPLSPEISSLPRLDIQAHHLNQPLSYLKQLNPPQLLQELLGRVLIGGIGRLYFERQSTQGRVLWSQDGVVKAILEGMSLSVFQGAINELKRLAHLSLIPVQQPRQVELERCFQEERLLLRLRVMPTQIGEEATLQVLRGAALKFYQQQQVETLGRDALNLAHQLQRKLDELHHCQDFVTLETVPALRQLLASVDQQLEVLGNLKLKNEDLPS